MTNAAGIATIRGLEGQPTSSLADLGFDYRTDGHCGAGAPRFNVGVQPAVGPSYTFFVGCQGMSDTGSYSYGGYQWVRKDYTGPFPPGTITSLQIVFDEGNDQGQGYVYLDNIRVNAPNCGPGISAPGCWTGAADNGNH